MHSSPTVLYRCQNYLCSVVDGYSRYIVNWDLREKMTEADIEIILERAKELYPEAKPRIISDNGPQFIAMDFKEFIRISGMIHLRVGEQAGRGRPTDLAWRDIELALGVRLVDVSRHPEMSLQKSDTSKYAAEVAGVVEPP